MFHRRPGLLLYYFRKTVGRSQSASCVYKQSSLNGPRDPVFTEATLLVKTKNYQELDLQETVT